ncbi:MAG: hypothetical protein WCJ61_16155, partial [Paludibacter sp.]
MKKLNITIAFLLLAFNTFSDSIMLNPYNRKDVKSLNGEWNVIIDPFCRGEISGFFKNKKASKLLFIYSWFKLLDSWNRQRFINSYLN